jgi:hypothetical protein
MTQCQASRENVTPVTFPKARYPGVTRSSRLQSLICVRCISAQKCPQLRRLGNIRVTNAIDFLEQLVQKAC